MANSTPQQDAIVRRAAIIKSHAERIETMATDYQQGMVSHARFTRLIAEEIADMMGMAGDLRQMVRDLQDNEIAAEELAA